MDKVSRKPLAGQQMSSASLPSLSVGANEIVYRDDTERPHRVQITHGWRESSEASPPLPPANSISPSDGAHMELGLLRELRWEAARCPDGDSIADYHIQISPRADMLHPISPGFDRITFSRNPQWDIPQGWLLRGKTYFWRVRARNGSGVWSPWKCSLDELIQSIIHESGYIEQSEIQSLRTASTPAIIAVWYGKTAPYANIQSEIRWFEKEVLNSHFGRKRLKFIYFHCSIKAA